MLWHRRAACLHCIRSRVDLSSRKVDIFPLPIVSLPCGSLTPACPVGLHGSLLNIMCMSEQPRAWLASPGRRLGYSGCLICPIPSLHRPALSLPSSVAAPLDAASVRPPQQCCLLTLCSDVLYSRFMTLSTGAGSSMPVDRWNRIVHRV